MQLSSSEDENRQIGIETSLNDIENSNDIKNNKKETSPFNCTDCGKGFNRVSIIFLKLKLKLKLKLFDKVESKVKKGNYHLN